MIFIERLENLLKEKKITKQKFLSDNEIGKNQIMRWRNSEVIPKKAVINQIAAYLDVDPEYLTGESDIKKQHTEKYTDQEKELIDIFRGTTEKGRIRIIAAIVEIAEEIQKELENKSNSDTKIG